jgi:chemotaxis protein MotB
MMHHNGGSSQQHDEEENYFISMTDMMVGVLFIFIIMLMVFALNFREQTDNQADETERLQQASVDLSKEAKRIADRLEDLQAKVDEEVGSLEAEQWIRNDLLDDIQTALAREGLTVEVDERNGVLRLTEDSVSFERDEATLDDQARENVLRIAAALASVLPRYTACQPTAPVAGCGESGSTTIETVFIEGHTDRTGTADRNWSLSTQRAVVTYRLIDTAEPTLAMLANRDGNQIISVSGYGPTRPVTTDPTPNDYAPNRRIDLRFVMETDQRGSLEEIRRLTAEMQEQINALSRAVER